jgi:hypothetical protein
MDIAHGQLAYGCVWAFMEQGKAFVKQADAPTGGCAQPLNNCHEIVTPPCRRMGIVADSEEQDFGYEGSADACC